MTRIVGLTARGFKKVVDDGFFTTHRVTQQAVAAMVPEEVLYPFEEEGTSSYSGSGTGNVA